MNKVEQKMRNTIEMQQKKTKTNPNNNKTKQKISKDSARRILKKWREWHLVTSDQTPNPWASQSLQARDGFPDMSTLSLWLAS